MNYLQTIYLDSDALAVDINHYNGNVCLRFRIEKEEIFTNQNDDYR